MRLFAGIAVPGDVGRSLRALQPAAVPGVSNVGVPDMHLTLHFLGDMNPDDVVSALAGVAARRPRILVRGVGQFRLRRGRRIFWAGVEPNRELAELHAEVGRALETIGFIAEARPFLPHVTLARISGKAGGREIDALVAAASDRRFGDFEAPAFDLFDTAPPDSTDRYRRVRTFALGS